MNRKRIIYITLWISFLIIIMTGVWISVNNLLQLFGIPEDSVDRVAPLIFGMIMVFSAIYGTDYIKKRTENSSTPPEANHDG